MARRDSTRLPRLRNALKRIVANVTLGTDMSGLFAEVLSCMQMQNIEIKKLVYLYLVNYAPLFPDLATMAINTFVKVRSYSVPVVASIYAH